MASSLEIRRSFIAHPTSAIFITLVLASCSQSPPPHNDMTASKPDPEPIIVVGQGTDKERDAINASNQQIFDAEHSGMPINPPPSPVPATTPPPRTAATPPAQPPPVQAPATPPPSTEPPPTNPQ